MQFFSNGKCLDTRAPQLFINGHVGLGLRSSILPSLQRESQRV